MLCCIVMYAYIHSYTYVDVLKQTDKNQPFGYWDRTGIFYRKIDGIWEAVGCTGT